MEEGVGCNGLEEIAKTISTFTNPSPPKDLAGMVAVVKQLWSLWRMRPKRLGSNAAKVSIGSDGDQVAFLLALRVAKRDSQIFVSHISTQVEYCGCDASQRPSSRDGP